MLNKLLQSRPVRYVAGILGLTSVTQLAGCSEEPKLDFNPNYRGIEISALQSAIKDHYSSLRIQKMILEDDRKRVFEMRLSCPECEEREIPYIGDFVLRNEPSTYTGLESSIAKPEMPEAPLIPIKPWHNRWVRECNETIDNFVDSLRSRKDRYADALEEAERYEKELRNIYAAIRTEKNKIKYDKQLKAMVAHAKRLQSIYDDPNRTFEESRIIADGVHRMYLRLHNIR